MNLFNEWNGISWDIKEDKSGNIFIAADDIGIIKLNPASNDFSIYSTSMEGTKLTREKKLFTNSDGEVFLILPERGFYKYSRSEDQFALFSFSELPVKKISAVAETDNGVYFIAGDKKIFRYLPRTNKYDAISDQFDEINELRGISDLFLDSENNLWVGSQNQLIMLNLNNYTITKFTSNGNPDKRIQPGPVVEIIEDNTGIIWVGSYLGGITKISKKNDLFTAVNYKKNKEEDNSFNRIASILPLTDSEFLIGASDGLSIYNHSQKKFKNILTGSAIYSIIKTDSEKFWVGTSNGIFVLDDNFKVIKEIKGNPDKANSLSSNYITAIQFDKNGNLWAGTANGLNKIDFKKNKITRYTQNDSSSAFDGRIVLSLYIDKYNYIWAGTYSGLNRFDPTTNSFKLYKHNYDDTKTISNNYVFSYCEDKIGNFWIGTGNGLNKFDYNTETFEFISESDGLVNGVIFGIVEVDNNLLLSTANGICVYKINTGNISNYNVDHGIHSNMFNARSYAKSKNGDVVFGGLNGFTIINASEFLSLPEPLPVHITSISSIDNDLIVSPAYSEIKNIEFAYNTSYIKFSFSTVDFNLPENVNYKYMLERFDSTWVGSQNNSYAVYSKIPPGNYKFIVAAGGFEESAASINIIVTPPFWQAWWFYILVAAFIVLTTYFFYQNKLRLVLKHAREIEQIRNEEERKLRKKAADDFHDELGHRITKISLYSELLKRTSKDQESGSINYLRKISEISTNLATGVKDFIWTLDPGKDTLYDVAIRLKDFGDDLFDKSGISFRTSGIEQKYEDIEMTMDWRRHTILIFKEAMNNILKYSNAKNVLLTLKLEENEIDISLTDDGDGFDIERIKMGRGLKNIRMRAASVHGKIDIKSSIGKGTSINLHSSLK
jgi:signal transduction histidine kinase/ligand-binding sensor domain-containing protein